SGKIFIAPLLILNIFFRNIAKILQMRSVAKNRIGDKWFHPNSRSITAGKLEVNSLNIRRSANKFLLPKSIIPALKKYCPKVRRHIM
ncbi:hypothetical protein, partial [uncultured Muribaculum sp.]|uniref:hypothetical protein n=1 Tax=uncultured Muribaculum sp. TaxID=1918613 RepID=UPI0025A9A2E8